MEEFKISISRNAVSKSYHKHKNNDAFRTLQVGKEDSKENQKKDNSVSDVPKNVKSKRINEPIIPVIIQNDFDEDAGKNYDVNDFFMKE